jgi:hypothetical protein
MQCPKILRMHTSKKEKKKTKKKQKKKIDKDATRIIESNLPYQHIN